MRKGMFLVFLAIVGCKAKSPPPPIVYSGDGLILQAATVNLGDAPGVVRLATPRTAAIAEELSAMHDLGIICFEELWTQESKDAVIKVLGPDMHVYYEKTRGENQNDGVNVCSSSQVADTVSCGRKNKCGDWPAEEQSICMFEHCKGELKDVYMYGGSKCLSCLVASVGKSIDGILETCVQPNGKPPIAGASRAYDGQNGVLLASRWPLQNPETLRLRASFSNRVALFATIQPEGYEPIEVACTHLSTSTDVPPNHPDFYTWTDEMNAQVQDISKRLKKRAVNNRPSLFLGDMNSGPEIGDKISEEMPKVWKRIVELGFYSPVTDAKPPFCTMCSTNTLRPKSSTDSLIDHVLVRDPPGGTELEVASVYKFFDQPRQFTGYNGETVESNLSDHYGVVVNFRLRNTIKK